MAFNKQHKRNGNLFYKKFQRKQVQDESHLTTLISYIHKNPRKHKVQFDFENYRWSSFQTMLSEKATQLERQFVLDWFGGLEKFLEFHRSDIDIEKHVYLILE